MNVQTPSGDPICPGRRVRPSRRHGPADTPDRYSRTTITTHGLGDVAQGHVLFFQRLTGGDRTLSVKKCQCTYQTYSLRTRGEDAKVIGEEREVISAALLAVTTQPDVDVFALTVYASKEITIIIPRPRLPLMLVEQR